MKNPRHIFKGSRYDSELGDERWRDFSNDIRRTRGNACEVCRRANVETQVHHVFYERALALWEHSTEDVVLLCSSCHKEMHEHLRNFRRYVFRHLKPNSFKILNGALAVAMEKYDPLVFAHAVAEFVSTPSLVQRYADAWDASTSKNSESSEESTFERFQRSRTEFKAVPRRNPYDTKP